MENSKQTSPRVASEAGRILGNENSTPAERAVAASALAQAPYHNPSQNQLHVDSNGAIGITGDVFMNTDPRELSRMIVEAMNRR